MRVLCISEILIEFIDLMVVEEESVTVDLYIHFRTGLPNSRWSLEIMLELPLSAYLVCLVKGWYFRE